MSCPLSEDIELEECERVKKRQKQFASHNEKLNPCQQRAKEVSGEKGAESWLHIRLLETQGYHLTVNEFHDAVALRMGWTP